MSKTIYATFVNADAAERAVGALLDHGVRKEDVSIISSHDGHPDPRVAEETRGMAYEPVFGYNAALGAVAVPPVYTDPPSRSGPADWIDPEAGEKTAIRENLREPNDNTGSRLDENDGADTSKELDAIAKSGITLTTGADAEEGAKKGLLWGAGLGTIAGIVSLIVPGIGLVWGGGALALAVVGAVGGVAAGAAAGAVAGYLVDQGVDRHAAEQYQRSVNNGSALIAVTVPSGAVQEDGVQFLLDKYEASSISAFRAIEHVI